MNKTKMQNDPLLTAIGMIQQANPHINNHDNQKEIVDIITFCEHPLYLNLPGNNLNLYLPQKVILKCFYRGDIGNEDIKLDEQEWKWLYDNQENETKDDEIYEKNIKDVISKVLDQEKNPQSKFSQLQLVLGRRAGKTLLASIITAYEAYKLLAINKGDPHGYYDLPSGDEISIINVALSQEQAGILFGAIQSRLRDSPFFQTRIASEASDEIRLYTNRDLEKKNKKGALKTYGSIILKCGHSNPDSLAGRSAVLLLFDEIAYFDETGKVTGKYFFNRLKPSLSRFYKKNAGKIVLISSPNTRNGVFYETFEQSKTDSGTLSFQLPTWCVNQEVPYELEQMQRDRKANPEMFTIEYGAQWATGGTFGNFFEEGMIARTIRGDIGPQDRPNPKYNYYLHIDPAKKGNNYSAVLVAKERYSNHLGKRRNRCILANCWIWRPIPGVGLQFPLIDKDIIRICSIFHPIMVTYDDYHSMHSLQLLRSHGINTRQMPFNRNVKMKIYQNLRDLMAYEPVAELFLYDDGATSSLLIQELKCLKFKRTQRGFALTTDKNADVKTDDLADCLAGACSAANEGLQMALPEPVLVRTGLI